MAAQTPRAMAMVNPMSQQMAIEAIKPGWSAEARLPYTVRLPVEVSNTVWGRGNGRREIIIRKTDEVPSFIIEWMRTVPQYRTWFLSEQSEPEPKTLPAEQTEAAPVAVEVEPEAVEVDESDKPKRGRRKKAADGDN